MKNISKYIIISAVTLFIIGLAWYFSNILAYILISAVISLIGQPIMRFLTSFQIGKWKISNSIASILTLTIIISAILGFIFFLTPLIGKIITELSEIKLGDLTQRMAIPLQKYNAMLHELVPTLEDSVSIESMILEHIRSAIKVGTVSVAFSSFANFLFHMVISAFIIIFVSFFFLKDSNTFNNMVLALVPTKHEVSVKRALENVNKLLIRYFTGITFETILITALNTLGMCLITDLNFQTAVVLAFISGILNVIPYIGPLCGGAFGTIIGTVTIAGTGFYGCSLEILLLKFILIFTFTHLIDVFIFQPFIYSNSVKAHPLEIFIVILIAGNVWGIWGMLIAIPTYTVIRVFAKEFLSNFKVVQKLTDKI